MVAGEPSGDLLAARIIQGLRQGNPGVQVEGIGGPEMPPSNFTNTILWTP
jgi:lipid-A-disaccharide synthase